MIKAIGKLRRIVNILVNVEVLQIACVIQNKKVWTRTSLKIENTKLFQKKLQNPYLPNYNLLIAHDLW